MKVAESESDFRITKDTPYLDLASELCIVHCEDLGENRPRYNGIALYVYKEHLMYNSSSLWNQLPSRLQVNTIDLLRKTHNAPIP